MPSNRLLVLESEDRKNAVQRIIEESSPFKSFFAMVVLATALATLGLLVDNIPVIIGAMLVAPILSPILAIGMGIVLIDWKIINRSLFAMLKATLIAVATSTLIALLTQWEIAQYEFVYLLKPNVIFVYIAFISGLAAAYAWGHPRLGEALPGVAISVTLIPPLAGIGVGIAHLDWGIISGTFMLLLINFVCIILTSVIIFQLAGFYRERKSAEKAIKKEEKILKEDE
jgi:uncharacterized hydrophobic protein (TIGR00271 family)